jgi:hypothetical protein
MRFWTTDHSYNDCFNRLGCSPRFAKKGSKITHLGEVRGSGT